MVVIYFILIFLAIVFFTLGSIFAHREKIYKYNESQNSLETTSSSINVEKIISELDSDIENKADANTQDSISSDSDVVSEILDIDEEEI